MEILGGLLHLKLLRKPVFGEVFHVSTIFMLYDPQFPNNLKLYCPNFSITCTCYKIFTCHCSPMFSITTNVYSTRTTPSPSSRKHTPKPGILCPEFGLPRQICFRTPFGLPFLIHENGCLSRAQRMEIPRTQQNSMLTWWKIQQFED